MSMNRKFKRMKGKIIQETPPYSCPCCGSDIILRPPADLVASWGPLRMPVLFLYEALQVEKCGECGTLYDGHARDHAKVAKEVWDTQEEAQKEDKNREKTAMSAEEFEKLREAHRDLIVKP